MTMNVTPVNDPPVGQNNTVSTNEDTAVTLTTANFASAVNTVFDPADAPNSNSPTVAEIAHSALLARMFEAGPNGRQAGVEMAQELLLHAHTRYAGVYLMPSFGRYELCASVLDVLPRFGLVKRET